MRHSLTLSVPDKEKIEATKSLLLFGTLTLVVWMAIGALSIWLIYPLLGWLFVGFSVFVMFIIIRRLLCNSCYYCKSCTKGFAKLSKLTLGSNHIPGISKGSTEGMAATMYVILTGIPVIMLVNSLINSFDLVKIVLLSTIVGLTTYTLIVRARNNY